jgi:hypothetical protein
MGQNTKGERPVSNRGAIRRTEGKTVKKKSKASTRDIAGRRLRTKNKSSANRANVGIEQPLGTTRQPRRRTDRASRVPANKRFASQERRRSNPDRSWSGDISGSRPRRIKPSQSDANHANVYPQGRFATRQPPPKQRPFKGYEHKTASGKPLVKRSPQRSERAWKGDIKGSPFYPPASKTGRYSNVHSQKTRYSKYVSKRPSPRDKAFGNRDKVGNARRMGTDTSPKNWKRGTPIGSAGQAPFVTHGRKNVYWGKTKVGGRAITKDQAGRPLLRKNFRSQGMGIVGRDTLAFFGRKPHEGSVAGKKRKGRFLPGSEARGGWLNDIAGYRLRKHIPGGAEAAGARGRQFGTSTGFRSNQPIQGKTPGIGASSIERALGKTGGRSKGFSDQGGGYSGFLKQGRRGKFIGSRAGLWNNNRTPIGAKGVPASGLAAGRFSGRSRGGKNINGLGSDYTGNIKRKQKYGDAEYAYRGFIKGGKKQGNFIGARHGLWNNNGQAVTEIGVTRSGALAGNYSGNIKRRKLFADEEYAYRGFQKVDKQSKRRDEYAYRGFLKGGKSQGNYVGSVHRLWNNGGKATTEIGVTRSGALAGTFQGNLKQQSKGKSVATRRGSWNNNNKAVTEIGITKYGALAGNYHGNLKAKPRGTSVAATRGSWNNNGKAVTEIGITKSGALAGNFSGHTKAKERGKSVARPSVSWNNKGKAVTELDVSKSGALAGGFSGHLKAKSKKDYPLNTERGSWNNQSKATTRLEPSNAGISAGKFSGNTKFKRQSHDVDVDIEDRMKVKKDYVQNPHSVALAIKKEKPNINHRAGNFASGAKVIGKRTHGPHSVDDALDMYHNQASARRTDYQGNVKMRKFVDRRESPDARFIHTGENNVKEDRTLMTNVKLLWARLFQKSDSQPSNLKEKGGKMKYDKGEKGMWAD